MKNQNPEQIARDNIDRQLNSCGWLIQSKSTINLNAGIGIAVREYSTEVGPADYVLFVEGKPVGIIEAKREEESHKMTVHENYIVDCDILNSKRRDVVIFVENVMFEGDAPESICKKLLDTTNLHTILRLPTGIFFKQRLKSNVLLFYNKPAAKTVFTKKMWFYDFRTSIKFSLKKNPLRLGDLNEFIACYNPSNINKRKKTYHAETNPEGRWRKFTYDEINERDKTSLDITWIKDKTSPIWIIYLILIS